MRGQEFTDFSFDILRQVIKAVDDRILQDDVIGCVSIKPGSFFQDAVMHNTDNGGIMADGRIGSDEDLKLGAQSPKKIRVSAQILCSH